jgi:hypothetical protein
MMDDYPDQGDTGRTRLDVTRLIIACVSAAAVFTTAIWLITINSYALDWAFR